MMRRLELHFSLKNIFQIYRNDQGTNHLGCFRNQDKIKIYLTLVKLYCFIFNGKITPQADPLIYLSNEITIGCIVINHTSYCKQLL